MHYGWQNDPDGAEYLGESDQSDICRAEVLGPALAGRDEFSLGTNCFISPLPAKTVAKTLAAIHSAKFMMTSSVVISNCCRVSRFTEFRAEGGDFVVLQRQRASGKVFREVDTIASTRDQQHVVGDGQ
jgi:hypothetical protein